MREIQSKLKEVVNEIGLIRESIMEQLKNGEINKANFDDLLTKLNEAKESLERLKGTIAEKIND